MNLQKISLITIVMVVLSGCGPSAFETCLSAESQKLVQAHEQTLTPAVKVLMTLVPILEMTRQDRPRWQKYADTRAAWAKQNERFSLGPEFDQAFHAAHPEVIWADRENQHLTYVKIFDALVDGDLDVGDDNMLEKWEAFCDDMRATDPHCLAADEFFLAAINNRLTPDFEPAATEVCHSRGVY